SLGQERVNQPSYPFHGRILPATDQQEQRGAVGRHQPHALEVQEGNGRLPFWSGRLLQSQAISVRLAAHSLRQAHCKLVVCGAGGASFSSARNHEGGRRRGFGYTLGGVIER